MRDLRESSSIAFIRHEDTWSVDQEPDISTIRILNRSFPGLKVSAVPERAQIKYGILASVLLHVLVFAWFVRQIDAVTNKSMLKPGESLTNVKLIEQTVTKNEQEQPPQHSQAISDRNHTAEKERIPRIPGTLTPPLGKIEEQHSRMAAHMPPAAPEDISPLKEDHKAKSSAMKNLDPEPKTSKNKQKTKTPSPPNSAPKSTSKQTPDLKPTPREQQIAAGLSPHVGSPDFSPEGDVDEAVVDINTREEKFFSYLLHLKQKIQGVWVYPSSAARAGIGGSLTVEFSVSRNGELLYVNLLDSSGNAVLDESALRAIRVAAPYFPFPPRMTAKRLKIRANFVYITGDYFRRIL